MKEVRSGWPDLPTCPMPNEVSASAQCPGERTSQKQRNTIVRIYTRPPADFKRILLFYATVALQVTALRTLLGAARPHIGKPDSENADVKPTT